MVVVMVVVMAVVMAVDAEVIMEEATDKMKAAIQFLLASCHSTL